MRITLRMTIIALCAAGLLASVACEDDPNDLDYLKKDTITDHDHANADHDAEDAG